MQIKEDDEWKAAFQTNQGLFEPTVMFFGLCNSPTTFQTMMNNILIYSHTLSEHQQIVCQVLATLQEQRLFLKPEKCKFKQKEVEYLGLVILKDHVAMDLMKVCGVTEWPTPTKVKEVQSFLGFVNFYWKFIHDFSNIAHPLYALTHKTQQWVWGLAKQEAFNTLKGLSPPPQSSPSHPSPVTSTLSVMPQTSQPEQSSPKSKQTACTNQSPSCQRGSLM